MNKHTLAIFQALLVTVLWSSSWVFIKIGLQGIPPITFAGLRYTLGFLILLPFVTGKNFHHIKSLTKVQWIELFILGVVMYFLTQGLQFLSIKYVPSILIVLILAMTPVMVTFLSNIFLNESATPQQMIGVAVTVMGASLYLIPKFQSGFEFTWYLLIPIACLLANSTSSLFGRSINRREHLPAKVVTTVSMGVGSLLLLCTGTAAETFPELTTNQWLIVLWLAGINTAFAFTLWNQSLRYLTTVESSVINNTMMIQIAALTWIFFDEALTSFEIAALFITFVGTLMVQLKNIKLFSK